MMKLIDNITLYGRLIIERISDKENLNETLLIVDIFSKNVETLSNVSNTKQAPRNIRIAISSILFTNLFNFVQL